MNAPENNENRFSSLRQQMVEEQLAAKGIKEPRVLEAMGKVPRHAFVAAEEQLLAYEDRPLPIAAGQTISQPYSVAFMAEAAELKKNDRVLEIGAGCGYAASVFGLLAAEVHAVERVTELAQWAREQLARLNFNNVLLHHADGFAGWPSAAPYDAIIVSCGAATMPPALPHQLAEGGRLIVPIGDSKHGQTMFRFTFNGGRLAYERLGSFSFVPLLQGLL